MAVGYIFARPAADIIEEAPSVPVEAPLSFGQLYSWREVDSYPVAWKSEANLSATWDLRGFGADRIEVALRQLFDAHEPLRTSFELRDGVPVQLVHDDLQPPIERVTRLITSPRDADRTTAELLAIPFPMTGELCWRGRLVSWLGKPMFLALSFSHLILDVWSVQELHTQFRRLLTDPDDLEVACRIGPSPRQLASEQRADAGLRRQQSAERYWQRVLAERAARLPVLPTGVERNRIQATLHSAQLSAQTARAARALGVTAPAVLAALVAAGLSRQLAENRVVMSLMSSNRFAPEHRHVVGTMNQLIPVVVSVDAEQSLAEHIRKLHWAGAKAYRYASYDVDRVAALAGANAPTGSAEGSSCWFNDLFQCWFNYLQLDDRRANPADRSPAELAWTPLARQYGQPFDVRVTARNGRTSVALRVDPEVIPAAGLLDILRLVAAGVRQAALDPQASLATLWQATESGDDGLPATLFPAKLPAPPAGAVA
jgi:Condensation domain